MTEHVLCTLQFTGTTIYTKGAPQEKLMERVKGIKKNKINKKAKQASALTGAGPVVVQKFLTLPKIQNLRK